MYTDPSGEIPPLVIAALIMGAAAVGWSTDVGMQLYDHRAHGWGAWQRVNWGRAGMVAAASGAGAVVGTVAAPPLPPSMFALARCLTLQPSRMIPTPTSSARRP